MYRHKVWDFTKCHMKRKKNVEILKLLFQLYLNKQRFSYQCLVHFFKIFVSLTIQNSWKPAFPFFWYSKFKYLINLTFCSWMWFQFKSHTTSYDKKKTTAITKEKNFIFESLETDIILATLLFHTRAFQMYNDICS